MADKTVSHKLTRAEAVAMIKKAPRGAKFAVHIRGDARLVDSDEHVYRGALCSYVNVSRKEAARIADDMLTPTLEEKGGRLPLNVSSWTSAATSKTHVTYWIGG